MKINRFTCLVCLSLSFSLALSAQKSFEYRADLEEAGVSSERLKRIDTFMANYVRDGYAPNIVTFVARRGKVIHNQAYGWKNIENKIPVKTSDIFRIASQSKAITTVALMTLFEEGKFLLDDPLSNYIPEFKDVKVLDSVSKKDTAFYAHPAKKVLTVRHLLCHTAGITYQSLLYEKANMPYFNSVDAITIHDVVKKIASLPLKHEPGDAFTYGMSTDVVGYLIEVISGMPLDKFLKERIFDPLGMMDTYFYLPQDKSSRLVTLYSKDKINSKLVPHRNKAYQDYPVGGARTYFSGGAGLCGTIEDYAKFCQMLLNGGSFNGKQILSRKTIEMMTVNQIGNLAINGDGDKFGLGFQLFSQNAFSHLPGSLGSYRWGGMYATDYTIDPAEGLIMLVYTNVQPFANAGLHAKFRALVYQSLK